LRSEILRRDTSKRKLISTIGGGEKWKSNFLAAPETKKAQNPADIEGSLGSRDRIALGDGRTRSLKAFRKTLERSFNELSEKLLMSFQKSF
jgi:hypothetical protein